MSRLLDPFTDLLEKIGFDPILFAIAITIGVIFSVRKNYFNWEDQTKHQKEILILYLVALAIMVFAWLII